MNVNEALKKVATLLTEDGFMTSQKFELPVKGSQNDEPIQVNFSKYNLVDGSEVEISNLAVDGEVKVMQGDELLPASDGEYILADGTKFTVVDGKISEIASPEPNPTPVDMEQAFSDLENKLVDSFNAKLLELKTQMISAVEAKFSDNSLKVGQTFEAIKETLEAMASTATVLPTQTPAKFGANTDRKSSVIDAISKIKIK
jgi:hypothetical protein